MRTVSSREVKHPGPHRFSSPCPQVLPKAHLLWQLTLFTGEGIQGVLSIVYLWSLCGILEFIRVSVRKLETLENKRFF